MSARDLFVEAANAEIASWPGVSVAFGTRSKHRAATFMFRGVSRFVTYSTSPGTSWNGVRDFLADVRATLLFLGAERVEAKRSVRPPKRRRGSDRRASLGRRGEPLKHDPSRDPWAPLAALLETESAK